MTQQSASDFDIVPGSTTGTQLATLLDAFNSAMLTGRSGTSLPPDAVAGTVWRDTTSGTTHIVKYYNGTVSTELYSITVATGAIVLPASAFSGNITIDSAYPTIQLTDTTYGGGKLGITNVAGDYMNFVYNAIYNGTASGPDTKVVINANGTLTVEEWIASAYFTPTPSADADLANVKFVEDGDDLNLSLTGGTLTGTVALTDYTPLFELEMLSPNATNYFALNDSTGALRGYLSYKDTTGEVGLTRNSAVGAPETIFTLDSDGVTSNGKVNGATVHATNGATGTATSANTLTIVDGIITNIA